MAFYQLKNVQEVPLVNGITMQPVYGEKCSISYLKLPASAHVHTHHHDSEQISFVLEGEVEYTIENDTKICGPQSVIVVPAKAHHAIVVVSAEPARLLVTLAPPRQATQPLNYVHQ